MAQPLAGIRVLDLSRMAPGALCTMAPADLGADTVRIEQPGCGVIPLPVDEKACAARFALDRNKRSLFLDLGNPEARTLSPDLVNTSDAVLEGFRPGVVKQLPIDRDIVLTGVVACGTVRAKRGTV